MTPCCVISFLINYSCQSSGNMILLCPCIYGLQQHGHLKKSSLLCFLISSVLQFKIKADKINVGAVVN